ncbi:MAG: HlyD family efflux transporter periplasmic adaptor subunit [Pseudomonadales bacterium]|jgi:HlyD family secretion protein|nr:HlyD family efflux transporter periplasmic adaptor subunit [Pseudomonadales bacterium]
MAQGLSLPFSLFLPLLLLSACSGDASSLALGTLERDRLTLVATAAEIIVEQPVKEGNTVHKGEVIVQLDTTRQQAALAKAEADIAAQSALLDQLRNGARPEELAAAAARVDSARAALTQSEQNLPRVTDLVGQKLAAQAELDAARAARDGAAANLRDAEAQLALLRAGTREEQLRQAEAQLQALQALLNNAHLALDELTLRAPQDAILDSLPWETGERVNAGAVVAVLLGAGAPYARVYLPEPYRASMNVGASVQVLVDGVSEPFTGNVRWIALDPAFTPYYALSGGERARLVYLMEITLPPSAAALPAGLPAQLVLP